MTFETFWQDYPRKVGKEAARKAYAKAVKADGAQKILDSLHNWNLVRKPCEPHFIPHASTWLNQRRYMDDHEAMAVPALGRGEDITRRTVDNRIYSYIDALKIRELRNTRTGITEHQQRVLDVWNIR